MKTPHKHAELIHAYADGAEIQLQNSIGEWMDEKYPTWNLTAVYRIKPEPKPDFVYYGHLDEPARGGYTLGSCFTREYNTGDKIKIVFDGSTGKLKSAEVL